MEYLVMIPARGGSKGVAKKNIYPICGHPMIFYTLDLLKRVCFNGDVLVSTDDEEIIRISEAIIGGRDRFFVVKRPDEYATDEASTEVVAEHAVRYMEDTYGKKYDALITMAPNLPLRTPEMFRDCIEQFESMPDCFDSQVCFCKTDEDLWIKKDNNEFERMNPEAPRRRQERTPYYVEKGSVTISKIKSFLSTGSLWGNRVYGFEMDESMAIDVHDINDVHYLSFIIENNLIVK